MAEEVRKVDYYYVTVPNRPGEGARVLAALRSAGVNLLAVHAFPSGDEAQIDLVPGMGTALEEAAAKAKLPLSPRKTAFLVEGDDRLGAAADLLRKLADAKINVTAMEAVRAGAGRYG
ncbi:MAG: hypothetical protein ACREKI_04265, partial [Gemmatimonadota bacterium]